MPMPCHVYASRNKPDTYLWLAREGDFAALPDALRTMLGELRPVLQLALDENRRLPHEDTAQVLAHLRDQGWHLQLPPKATLANANHLAYGAGLPDPPTR